MKKIKLLAVSLLFAGSINAQLVDEQNVTITMDLQPILQLNMDGPSNIDFVFDEIYEYMGGITKYGATTLKVSSSVDWDLYAVGYSSGNTAGTGLSWDNQVSYGNGTALNGSSILSCSLLELRQNKANPANLAAIGVTGGIDYSSPFLKTVVVAAANNCIYTNAAPYTLPAATDKFIAGGNTTDPNKIIYRRGTKAYSSNTSWDLNKDGNITGGEIALSSVAAWYGKKDWKTLYPDGIWKTWRLF